MLTSYPPFSVKMTHIFPAFMIMGFGFFAHGQSASVSDIPLDTEQKTTITIEKGSASASTRPVQATSEVLDGTAEVTGDAKPLARVARESWAKSCEEWKKEVKDLNKENQILSLTCNSPTCTREGVLTVCKSTASYKIRMKNQ